MIAKARKERDEIVNYVAMPGLMHKYRLPSNLMIQPNIIELLVSEYYGHSLTVIRLKCRRREYVVTRQVMMYLMKRFSNMSLKDIGGRFHRDHTTVIHAIRTVNALMETQEQFKKQICELERKLE